MIYELRIAFLINNTNIDYIISSKWFLQINFNSDLKKIFKKVSKIIVLILCILIYRQINNDEILDIF